MALQLVKSLLKHNSENGFGRVLNKINVISAGNGQLTAEMKVEEEHTNYMGALHGGLTATIIDNLSSFALVTYKPNQKRGSSVNIQISYLNPAKLGDELLITANTVKVGKTIAFLEAKISEKTSGKIIATGSHIKFVME